MSLSNSKPMLSRDRNDIARFLVLAEAHERETREPGIGRRGKEGDLKRTGLAILRTLVLNYRNKKSGKAWPAIQTLATRANVSRAAAQRALNRLERAGYLSRLAQSKVGQAFDRRGRYVPIRVPSLITFYWPEARESKIAPRHTISLKYKKGPDGWPKRPTKSDAVTAMQDWLNRRDGAKSAAAAAEKVSREAETLAAIRKMRASGEI
jgi:DNA-binding MarR family transcriptional regulator